MTTPILNSGRFELSFFNKDDKEMEQKNVTCSEYKLYTDNNDLFLFVSFVSPLVLIEPEIFLNTFKLKLAFLNEEEKVITGYEFKVENITWELVGRKGVNNMPTWQVIYALSNEYKILKA